LITDIEPGFVTVPLKCLLAIESVSLESPSSFRIDHASESVSDNVQVGRYMKTIEFYVVSNVANYSDLSLWNDPNEPLKESGSSDSSG
jgi:hypothetical protein